MKGKTLLSLGGSLLMGIAGVAYADTVQSEDSLRAELMAVQARLAELEANQSENWLNQRRSEEIKTLVQDVLLDADTRASLLEDGLTAGHNGNNFYLASEDGGFLLNISGQIQIRHTTSFQDQEDDVDAFGAPIPSIIDDENESGFTIQRAKVQFDGHIADPRLQYIIRLAVDRQNNSVDADRIVLAYELMDGVTIWGGEDKAPFLREELTSSARQLAVERSYVNEIFTMDYAQGVGLKADLTDNLKAHVMVNDGSRSGNGSGTLHPLTQTGASQVIDTDGDGIPDTDLSVGATTKDFDGDRTDFAVTARADLKLAGNWSQASDFSAWDGEDTALFVGAAIHYEVGETGDTALNNDFLSWTVDGSLELNRANIYAAAVGLHTDLDGATGALVDDSDLYGVVVQAGYMIIPDKLEPFVRWEYIDFDDSVNTDSEEVQLITIGANYYLANHNAKFTMDVVWALDPLPLRQSGLGLQLDDPDGDDQVVLRAQFQLLF